MAKSERVKKLGKASELIKEFSEADDRLVRSFNDDYLFRQPPDSASVELLKMRFRNMQRMLTRLADIIDREDEARG